MGGNHQVNVKMGGKSIKGSPLQIQVLSVSGQHSLIEGKDFSQTSKVNEEMKFKVISHDQNGKRIPFGGGNLGVDVITPNNAQLRVIN